MSCHRSCDGFLFKENEMKILTSESVNIGHPDKTCDLIADAFLDEALSQDKNSQMAVECAIKNDKLFVYGEATTKAKIDYEKIAKNILKQIGYKTDFKVLCELSQQSSEINNAVVGKKLKANDQGIVFGYATNETEEFMPLPIVIAHKLMQEYEQFRQTHSDFFADAKSQVSVGYERGKPCQIVEVVVSVSHNKKLTITYLRKIIKQQVIDKVLSAYKDLAQHTKFLINPAGKFSIWGSFADSGCVGRKIVVDSYGGAARVGGGCYSSKNATKIDRSGSYYARFVAKNIVAHKFADRCEIQTSYAIGKEKPVSIMIECFGTNHISMNEIYSYVEKNFDFSVQNMIDELDLLKPIYKSTACYGHFGREEFSWEKIKN